MKINKTNSTVVLPAWRNRSTNLLIRKSWLANRIKILNIAWQENYICHLQATILSGIIEKLYSKVKSCVTRFNYEPNWFLALAVVGRYEWSEALISKSVFFSCNNWIACKRKGLIIIESADWYNLLRLLHYNLKRGFLNAL